MSRYATRSNVMFRKITLYFRKSCFLQSSSDTQVLSSKQDWREISNRE